jgi:hypothetical protein
MTAADSLQTAARAAQAPEPRKVPGRPFRKGQSGNPAGRKPGSQNRKTLLAQQLMDGESEALVHKVIAMALEGDPTALKLCIDRVVAPRRDRLVDFDLPKLKSAADLAQVMGAVTHAVAAGRITPAEALALAQTVATAMHAIETSDQELRLQEAEAHREALAAAAEARVAPAYARISRRQGLPIR